MKEVALLKTPPNSKPLDEAVRLLLLSISLEERSLGRLLKAETDKMELFLESPCRMDEFLKWKESSDKMVKAILKKEMLILSKLENTLKLLPCKVCLKARDKCDCGDDLDFESSSEE